LEDTKHIQLTHVRD